MFTSSRRVLVVAPHGLDEILGAGGTLARAAGEGVSLHLLVLFGNGEGRDAQRRRATEECAALVGLETVHYGGFPENRGDIAPLVDLVGAVERQISTCAPDTILTAHGGSLHIDHHRTARAVMTAARPTPAASVRTICSFEIQSSTEWGPPQEMPFTPTLFIDVTATLETKLAALSIYGDEMREPPHARSLASAEHLARTRGAAVGCDAAEAFMLLRQAI